MGEAAEAAGDGGSPAGDGGAGDACALGRGRGATGPAAEHTAAGRRVRPGHTFAAASPLSASRADEEQLPASTEQVRERRTRVGGRRRRWRGVRGGGAWRGWWQEGRFAAESYAVVGAHRRAGAAAVRRERAAPVRDGPAPRAPLAAAAGRVTPPPAPISRLHSIVGTTGLALPANCHTLGIYLFGLPRTPVCVP